MKRVRLALIGTGKAGDTYRVALPTYSMVSVDYGAKTAVVDVEDSVWPLTDDELPSAVMNDAKLGEVITGFTADQKVKAALEFDKKYAEHSGEYVLDAK